MHIDIRWLRDPTALADAATGQVLSCNDAFTALLSPGSDVQIWSAIGCDTAFEGERRVLLSGRWHSVRVSAPEGSGYDGLLLAELRDIHESELARERYHTILETSFDGFWDWKLKEDWEFMSPQFWRMFGYEPDEKEHKPSAWQDMIDPGDFKEAIANLGKHVASRGEHPYFQKVRYRHKQGHTVTVLCKGRVVEWDEATGDALRMIGTHTDITLLDGKERQLRAQLEEFAAVVNQTGVPVFAVDMCGDVHEWNDAMELLTGRTRRDMVGRPLEEALADPAGMRQLLELMREPGSAGVDAPGLGVGGASPPQPVRVQELQDMGLLRQDLQQQDQPDAAPTAPAAAAVAAGAAGAAAGHGSRAALALSLRGPDGSPVDFIATLLARRDAGGSWRGALLVGSDMTDVLAAKTALIAERERADAEAGLNEYIAHEVRNPLTVAMSATRFLASSLPLAVFADDEVRDSCAQDLNLLSSSLVYINELLANMLDLNRFVGGKAKLEIAPMCLRDDVLQPVRAMLNRSMSGVSLNLLCEAPLWVTGDALRLKQIMVNLAKNAIKFVTAGFINLSARRDPAGRFGENTLLLTVEDSGPGIPASQRDTLFHKYQESLDKLRQGTGIGLSLCKVLATAMGGEIRHDPAYDSGVAGSPGSRFEVALPLPPFQVAELAQPADGADCGSSRRGERRSSGGMGINGGSSSSNTPHGAGIQAWQKATEVADEQAAAACLFADASCLIVDDESLLRVILKRRLASVLGPGAHFEEAASAEAALELLAAGDPNRFELILVDHYMPTAGEARNGAEFIRDARAAGAVDATIVGCSANDVSALHLQAGADAFVRKPLPDNAALSRILVGAARVPPGLRLLLVDDERLNRLVLRRLLATFAPAAEVLEASTSAEAEALLRLHAQAHDCTAPRHLDAVFLDESLGGGKSGSQLAAEARRRCEALGGAAGVAPVLVSVSGASGSAVVDKAFDLLWQKPYPPVHVMKATLLRALKAAVLAAKP